MEGREVKLTDAQQNLLAEMADGAKLVHWSGFGHSGYSFTKNGRHAGNVRTPTVKRLEQLGLLKAGAYHGGTYEPHELTDEARARLNRK